MPSPEDVLRADPARYRRMFQEARDAHFVTGIDGRILEVNPACLDLLGMDSERLHDYRAQQFYVHEGDRERFRRRMLEDGGVTDFEVELRDTRGRRFTALYSSSVWRGPSGEILGFCGTVRDVTERQRVLEALRRSRRGLEEAQRIAHVGSWEWDLGTGLQRWSDETYRILGLEPGATEPSHAAFLDRVHPEDRATVEGAVRRAVQEGAPYGVEFRILRPDREVRYVRDQGGVRHDEAGGATRMLGMVHDVTERRVAEDALRASERRFRSLVEDGSDLIVVLDASGAARYRSPAFERVLGYAEGVLDGGGNFHLVHPDDREEVRLAFHDLVSRPGGRVRAEYRFRHADGSWRVLETRAVNLLDDPAVGGVVVSSRDVTDRREAERAAQASSARLRAILDTITDAVVLVDAGGTIEFANPAAEEILGVTPTQASGRRFDDRAWKITAVDGGPLSPEELPFVRVMTTGQPVRDARHAIERPSGERAVLSVSAAPLRDGSGAVSGMVASVQDVTERIRAEHEVQRLNVELEQRVRERTAQLSAANRELEAFAYSVSHDLRAPLRALDGFSHALMEDHAHRLDGEALDFLRRIRAASLRMARLIDDILQLSRVSRRDLRREDVDLADIARDVMEMLREAEPTRAVELVTPATLPARADPQLVRLVLENLLGNAWKFTEGVVGARIELGVEEGRTYYVRDNGVGFDMRYADKLFKPFHRLHRDSEFEGTGVGLATVSRIVTRHGGTVTGAGEVGKGAVFRFTLGEEPGR